MTQTSFKPADFDTWAKAMREHFEVVAQKSLPQSHGPLGELAKAMRYAVLDGGKRVRALLVYAAGALTMAHPSALDSVALAIEYVHAYSLVHDDMPCMDNDVLRRGKPTAHVQFGESLAMLAGDALQPEAFSVIGSAPLTDTQKSSLMIELAQASGFHGMCGGQAIDLLSVGKSIDIQTLRAMHGMKTGALIRASVRMGALCGQTSLAQAMIEKLDVYASALGLAFQVVDDILDVTADSTTLGKTAGKDQANDKPTYVSLMGLQQARKLAQSCYEKSLSVLDEIQVDVGISPINTLRLRELAHYIIGRNY